MLLQIVMPARIAMLLQIVTPPPITMPAPRPRNRLLSRLPTERIELRRRLVERR